MVWGLDPEDSLALIAAPYALVFGAFVAWQTREQRSARLLGPLLMLEGAVGALFLVGSFPATRGTTVGHLGDLTALTCMGLLAGLYAVFLRQLDSPLTRPLRAKWARVLVGVVFWALPALVWAYGAFRLLAGPSLAEDDPALLALFPAILGFVVIAVFGFFVAVGLLRRAAKGTGARSRAMAYTLAFGLRDALYALGLLANLFLLDRFPVSPVVRATESFAPIGTILFVTFLAYGILRTQLFDIDLRVKTGISRGTVASIILVAVFVGAKIVESYLNRTAGFVAGSVVAGALLFVVPKLNKVGEKVANTAMPQVQPTSDYIAFKKLEVYRAAVEAAHETGGITEKDRASLDRLRAKLGLKDADATALEADVLPASA
jgi:hypothetical protein